MLTQAELDAARKLADALQAALTAAAAGQVDSAGLPQIPAVSLQVSPIAGPSADVAAAVANAEASRKAFLAETDAKKAAAILLSVASQLGQSLFPLLGTVLGKL